ncbi:PepSY domain-containing protein [Vibrio hepatarius]|uniref:PepSY domain-containing protein n=1 Tax=Vibrio hepatarius TaxID=171383 RepID=UPI001C09D260|nr:PepSY domain-containing protein [Vibrio hepatarius]MBU2899109.1 hypothetical protein [Vibrio hepatarius]
MFHKQLIGLLISTLCMLTSAPVFAKAEPNKDGHALVQDIQHAGTQIEIEEDQDEVYDAVRQGYIRPFSELYAAVEKDLHGRIIKVELDEDDDIWIYELKLNYNNNIIKVEYNAQTLEMILIEGHNVKQALRN